MPKTPRSSVAETAGMKGRGGGNALDQLDLFVAFPGDIPTHDQQEMMERPFFSLSKGKRTEPIDYRVTNGTTEIRVKVTANAETGMATIWDADILIWAASQIREGMARGIPTSRKFRVSLYELLKAIGRPTGGAEYGRIVEALRRLKGTVIETTIRQKGTRPHGFGWIEEWSAPTDEQGRSRGIEFTIAEWLYQGIRDDKLVLSIDREYFDLTGGIERWLYRVVRKHGGHQDSGWAFTMAQLHHKSGSTRRLADFAKDVRKVVEQQRLPGYWLALSKTEQGQETLSFSARAVLPVEHPGFETKRLPRLKMAAKRKQGAIAR
jgi:plasmid replication initiation protein